jgi:hypothetical protein
LAPIKDAYNTISNGDARQVLKESGWKANELVQPYQAEVRKAVGLKRYR